MKTEELIKKRTKEYGVIIYIVLRSFEVLEYISPSRYLFKRRLDMQIETAKLNEDQKHKIAVRRARSIDIYILTLVFIEILTVFMLQCNLDTWIIYPVLLLVFIRAIEIVQITGNLTLFDHIRWSVILETLDKDQTEKIKKENRDKYPHLMVSATRTLINIIVNYLELIILFGIIYFLFPREWGHLAISNHGIPYSDFYYYSAISQLTIGFEEIYPHGALKAISLIQMGIGISFVVIAIAKILSLSPSIKSVVEKTNA